MKILIEKKFQDAASGGPAQYSVTDDLELLTLQSTDLHVGDIYIIQTSILWGGGTNPAKVMVTYPDLAGGAEAFTLLPLVPIAWYSSFINASTTADAAAELVNGNYVNPILKDPLYPTPSFKLTDSGQGFGFFWGTALRASFGSAGIRLNSFQSISWSANDYDANSGAETFFTRTGVKTLTLGDSSGNPDGTLKLKKLCVDASDGSNKVEVKYAGVARQALGIYGLELAGANSSIRFGADSDPDWPYGNGGTKLTKLSDGILGVVDDDNTSLRYLKLRGLELEVFTVNTLPSAGSCPNTICRVSDAGPSNGTGTTLSGAGVNSVITLSDGTVWVYL